jgi:lipase chaperone LimK
MAAPRPSRAGWLAGGVGLAGVAALCALVAGTAVPPPGTASPAAASAPFAPSLAGTTVDGAASAAGAEALALDPALVRLFDYYLSTLGERPVADIRAQLALELDRRLPPAAAARAKDVMSRYLAFREALRSEPPAKPAAGRPVDLLRARLRAMQAIRARYFDATEIAALFGPDDRAAAATLARMEAEQDPALGADERSRRLAALDAAAPADERAAREASLSVIRLDEAARRLRDEGAGEDEVWRLRAAAVSPEAANRLADLDREEAAWKARIADYLAQRRALLSSDSTAAGHQDAVAALRSRLFTPDEQPRLPAYEGPSR